MACLERVDLESTDGELTEVLAAAAQRNGQQAAHGRPSDLRRRVVDEDRRLAIGTSGARHPCPHEVPAALIAHGDELPLIADQSLHAARVGTTEVARQPDDPVEHRHEITRVRADQREHLARRSLQFERLCELGEQTSVGDGNGGLVGERLEDPAVTFLERADLEPGDHQPTEDLVTVDEGDRQQAAGG